MYLSITGTGHRAAGYRNGVFARSVVRLRSRVVPMAKLAKGCAPAAWLSKDLGDVA